MARNRAKRLLRESFRRLEGAPGLDLVVVPKSRIVTRPQSEVDDEFRRSLRRLASRGPRSPPLAVRGLLLLIEAYRVTLSPLLGGLCRYEPSCSRYAEEALRRHGARRGATLALKRLARCHPFRPGGFDPVP